MWKKRLEAFRDGWRNTDIVPKDDMHKYFWHAGNFVHAIMDVVGMCRLAYIIIVFIIGIFMTLFALKEE